MSPSKAIRIAVLIGTNRPGNYTSKAVALVVDELENRPGVHVDVFDPAAASLPFPGGQSTPDQNRLQDMVKQATGVIIATPEYHGTLASMCKLIIENLGFPSALSGKPVALLGVAAGQIGAIKSIEVVRSTCSHVGAIVLPGPVSVAQVQKVFDKDGHCLNEKIEKRIRGLPGVLIDYIEDAVCPKYTLEAIVRGDD